MARKDLLLLTEADLADITNRGTVKRATKELDGGRVTCDLTDEDGTITATWSDGPVSVVPANKTLADGVCDCPAPGVCRHLVRLVLAYQASGVGDEHAEVANVPWSPGDISDNLLEGIFPARTLNAVRAVWDAGLVVELVRSTKPVARFHRLRHTVRFLVPGDVRYTQCDCTETAPCRHALLAVWSFRRLGAERASAIIDTEPPATSPTAMLDETESAIRRVVEAGFSNTPESQMDRLQAAEARLRAANIVWPAEVLADLRRQYDHYHTHDSRFSPDELANLVGEFAIRADALRAPKLPIPQLFVRGQTDDQDAKIGQSRLFGLGCTVRTHRRSAQVLALLQDDSTGMVVAVSRHFPDPEEGPGDDFSSLASRLVVKGRDLQTIGAGQVVLKTGTLYSDHRLSFGRSDTSVYAQKYRWEELRAPVLMETFDDVRARLANLPPASLRPRRLGENLHVLKLAAATHVRFSTREHAIRATLVDDSGGTAELVHPYSTRNRHGTERALNWLSKHSDRLLFVAGNFRLSTSGLVVAPTALVFDGPERTLVQPWVDDMDAHLESSTVDFNPPDDAPPPLDRLRSELAVLLGETILTGMDGVATDTRWHDLAALAGGLQLHSIKRSAQRMVETSGAGARGESTAALVELSALCKLAQELG